MDEIFDWQKNKVRPFHKCQSTFKSIYNVELMTINQSMHNFNIVQKLFSISCYKLITISFCSCSFVNLQPGKVLANEDTQSSCPLCQSKNLFQPFYIVPSSLGLPRYISFAHARCCLHAFPRPPVRSYSTSKHKLER